MDDAVRQNLLKNRERFEALLKDCQGTYLTTSKGLEHRDLYISSRAEARENWEKLRTAPRGEAFTDLVLEKLLPYLKNKTTVQTGVWINPGGSTATNIKTINGDKIRPEDWPSVSQAIFDFVAAGAGPIAELPTAVSRFNNSGFNKGFQSGRLSPILSALWPEKFAIVNEKTLKSLEISSGLSFKSDLSQYPKANSAVFELLSEYDDILQKALVPDLYPVDLFDLCSYWLSETTKLKILQTGEPTPSASDGSAPLLWSPIETAGRQRSGRPAFSDQAFELLKELAESPNTEFFENHKAKIEDLVTKRARDLFDQVSRDIPGRMSNFLDTRKGVVSRFRKQNSSRDGLRENYYGAFYPRRIGNINSVNKYNSEQLSIIIDGDGIDFGFGFGENFSKKRRPLYMKSCKSLKDILAEVVKSIINDSHCTLEQGDVDGWFNFGHLMGLRLRFTPEEVVTFSLSELTEIIEKAFRVLFPLVLPLSTSNPRDEILHYWRTLPNSQLPTNSPVVISPPDQAAKSSPYSIERMASDTYTAPSEIERWVRALNRKGQIIFYGPPGTGKTFLAEKLARHTIGGGDGFSELIQFHPSYAYEDFMEGIRPRAAPGGGFTYEMVPGRFLDFCRRAEKCSGICVLIIDEINRAELSRVFGELMYLLEYRSLSAKGNQAHHSPSIPLAGGTNFKIPSNVRIIGTMNTADRSIALVDHALRRRFAFVPVRPDFKVLERYHAVHNPKLQVGELVDWLKVVNTKIGNPHYSLGVSYFLRPDLAQHLHDIWRMEIEPYLEEFFFDGAETASALSWAKSGLGDHYPNLEVAEIPEVDFDDMADSLLQNDIVAEEELG